MTERLLDQIARFLDEEDFPYYTESKGANGGTNALMLARESWGTIVRISV